MSDEVRLPFLKGVALKSEKYTAIPRGGSSQIFLPPRNAREHSAFIRDQINALASSVANNADKKVVASKRTIVSVQMATSDGVDPSRLESTKRNSPVTLLGFDEKSGLAILDASPDFKALVGKLDQYDKSIENNAESPRNRKLIDYIEGLRPTTFSEVIGEGLKADWATLDKNRSIWLEFHVRGGYSNQPEAENSAIALREAFARVKIDFQSTKLRVQMPEEDIYFALLSINSAAQVFDLIDCVFEIELPAHVTLKWLEAEHRPVRQIPRITFSELPITAPEVVILDSGIMGEHPLLKPVISGIHSVLDSETGADAIGHGTEMAGVVTFGEALPQHIQSGTFDPIARVRSVQLLKVPREGSASEAMSDAWPALTEKAIEASQSGAADVQQIFVLAVTAESKFGEFSSTWTNAVDKAAYNDGRGRLIFVSTGNQRTDFGPAFVSDFPESLLLQKLEEPANSFNAVAVGACTNLSEMPPKEYEKYTALARPGSPSPYTKVGYANSSASGIKPDVVFEGGNRGVDERGDGTIGGGISTLSVISTSRTLSSAFAIGSSWGTSCAAALAANFASKIWSVDSSLRPETVRGLVVHSASWTDEMRRAFRNRKDELLSVCGYGVPDIGTATSCIRNRATMIFEDELAGIYSGDERKEERRIKFYEIPVPEELANSNEEVGLRVTLSYFAEPNGYRRRVSRGLDLAWKIQGPNEDREQFRARVNGETRKELKKAGVPRPETKDFPWEVGPQKRGRGTVQSDRWIGPASFVAGKKLLAVYPVNGWWDFRKPFKTKAQRFSLIVTVQTAGFDIYTPISVQVGNLGASLVEV